MNTNQIVRELVAHTAMEIIVGKTDVDLHEILDCWAEDKHHLAALPLYPMFASLDFDALLKQFAQLYKQLLLLACEAKSSRANQVTPSSIAQFMVEGEASACHARRRIVGRAETNAAHTLFSSMRYIVRLKH